MSRIPLHPTRGLDPHLMTCRRCGKGTSGMTVGHLKAFVDNRDNIVACYAAIGFNRRDMEEANPKLRGLQTRDVREYETVYDNEPCDECKAEITEHSAIVAAGGIYWKCQECHQEGVIRPSEYATAVRESVNIAAPAALGMGFDTCIEHTPV